jgi:hypothetical protein
MGTAEQLRIRRITEQIEPPRRQKEDTLEWRETYPPVALSPDDPRYWPYKESTVAPSIVHNAVPPYGAVVIDDHIYAAREFEGKYWPVFKHWHGILERGIEEILILEKVA